MATFKKLLCNKAVLNNLNKRNRRKFFVFDDRSLTFFEPDVDVDGAGVLPLELELGHVRPVEVKK